ncbi:MAG TPA: MFS transporter [Methylomirabilota bacterium]|nr:MFS transporter [Methylomirabilota bacterium]
MASARPRSVLATAGAIHFVHDGFSEILYVLLPVWAGEFRLSLWQVGLIRSAYTGGMAAFQIPAGLLAERLGERPLLMLGTLATAGAFIGVAAGASGFLPLLVLLTLAGLGSGVQHPLSSSVVAKAYEDGPRRAALGTYNFAGDIGKVTSAAVVGLVAGLAGWRVAATGYGVLGIVAALLLMLVLTRLRAGGAPRRAPAAERVAAPAGWGIRDPRGFQALSAIGMIDNATRSGLLTFLPFVLVAKGMSVAGVGGALALVFAGGAMGKFVCGMVAERVGIIHTVVLTEAATSVAILAILASPLSLAMVLLVPLGIALNGTSSVLYATVADLVTAERRSRAYGLYYTLSIGASALGPTLYGLVGDAVGAAATLGLIATVVLTTIPLCFLLRTAVAAPARG